MLSKYQNYNLHIISYNKYKIQDWHIQNISTEDSVLTNKDTEYLCQKSEFTRVSDADSNTWSKYGGLIRNKLETTLCSVEVVASLIKKIGSREESEVSGLFCIFTYMYR